MIKADEFGLRDVRLGFIGAGVMAESMIAGLLGKGIVGPDQIVASHPRADRRARMNERFAITVVETNQEAASNQSWCS